MKVSSEVRRGIQFLGAGVRGGCELPYVGSGNLEIKLMPSAMASKAFNSSAAFPVQLATFYLKKKKAMKASSYTWINNIWNMYLQQRLSLKP